MSSQKFIPKQHIGAPDFKRGTMGNDMGTHVNGIDGPVTSATTRNAIASYSKTAHFSFN